jgi:hypothetical protein
MLTVQIVIDETWGSNGEIRIKQISSDLAEFKVKNMGRWKDVVKSDTATVKLTDLLPAIKKLLAYSTEDDSEMMWLDGYTTKLKITGYGDKDVDITWQCNNMAQLTAEIDKLAQRINSIRRIA